jgi:hypothetical protein
MNINDKIILNQILDQQRVERAPTASKSEFFEMFVAEQALKEHDLTFDELEAGLTGSGGDGGIDAMYVLVNGDMAQEDIDLTSLKKSVLIELVIIQAKVSDGFKESAIEKMTAASEDIFDLSKDLNSLETVYNQGLRTGAEIFRMVYKGLAAKFPTLRFRFVYASIGSEVHPNVNRKTTLLGEKIRGLFSNADFGFEFFGASDLLALARRQPPTSHELALAETPITSAGDIAYICLVRLHEYDKFICDGSRQLRRNLFESNVRDYQGSTAVNDEIAQSLRDNAREDFWWLNNGITIVAGKATQSGKTLTLEDPQIVNGLQTSTEIFRYFSEARTDEDKRNVLVRVIVPTKAESRDRVIKATNSQTNIPPASLRATDKIHRDIEEYLRPYGLYYDRRKNFHKNEGRPLEKIVSISLMAQSVMAVLLQRADDARARPSSLLKKDSDYDLVFSTGLPIAIYRVCASILKQVDSVLRSEADLDARERNNLRFYIAMRVAAIAAEKKSPSATDLAMIDPDSLTDELIRENLNAVKIAYAALGGGDRVAKGPNLVERIKNQLAAALK